MLLIKHLKHIQGYKMKSKKFNSLDFQVIHSPHCNFMSSFRTSKKLADYGFIREHIYIC